MGLGRDRRIYAFFSKHETCLSILATVRAEFEYYYCYVNKLKPNGPNTINFVESGLKNWALVRVATTGHDRK